MTRSGPSCGPADRFRAVYHVFGREPEARSVAEDICVEQTIELPLELVRNERIRNDVVGRVESLRPIGARRFAITISYAVATVGSELTQLLNVAYGNISMKRAVRLEHLELPTAMLRCLRGPRHGPVGLRELLGAPVRPLLCAALKPVGLSARELAEQAGRLARGGMDLVKDDHGLANQPLSPFADRVGRCAAAVARANRQTGRRCLYVANVTAPADALLERARLAKDLGAGALLAAPGLVGFDAMRMLADADTLGLPIVSHPAFLGWLAASARAGLGHRLLFGELPRLAGADAAIFPSYGGRFPFTRRHCREIASGARAKLGPLRATLPAAAGGMALDRIDELTRFYGADVILLVGADLHRAGPDFEASARGFRAAVDASALARAGRERS